MVKGMLTVSYIEWQEYLRDKGEQWLRESPKLLCYISCFSYMIYQFEILLGILVFMTCCFSVLGIRTWNIGNFIKMDHRTKPKTLKKNDIIADNMFNYFNLFVYLWLGLGVIGYVYMTYLICLF